MLYFHRSTALLSDQRSNRFSESTFVFAHNFDNCQQIFIIFGKHTLQEICKNVFYK